MFKLRDEQMRCSEEVAHQSLVKSKIKEIFSARRNKWAVSQCRIEIASTYIVFGKQLMARWLYK